MNVLSPSPYRKHFLFGLLVFVICAWFSVGYNHPDEHFQVLEFANYKLGLSPVSDLPWEYFVQCRSAVQPFIVFCFCKAFMFLGLYNPFFVVFFLRLLMGIFAWWVTCRLVLQLLPEFKSETGKKLFVLCSLFLWYVPYLNVRFSSENLGGILFFLSISLFLEIPKLPETKKLYKYFLAGLFLGFMLFIRVQLALALFGLGIWLLFVYKLNWRYWIILFFAAIVAFSICIVIDYWFYGAWMFTPYNYFHVNIVLNISAKFGVFPWWWYFHLFFQNAVPPLSIVLLALFIFGIWHKPLNLFSLLSITFLIGHFLIGHKEMRFLYPISIAFIYLVCIGLDVLIQKYVYKNVYGWFYKLLVFTNVVVLIYRVFAPAEEVVEYFDFLYKNNKIKNETLIYFKDSPYKMVDVESNFYKPKNVKVLHFKSPAQLSDYFNNSLNNQTVLYLSHNITPEPELTGFKLKKMYSLFPDWLLKNDYNNWQERANIWIIYEVSKL